METISYSPRDLSKVTWQQAKAQLSAVRTTVFVHEQNVPIELEMDELDTLDTTHHWLMTNSDGEPIATARMLASGKIGRVAVLKQYRGQHLGNLIMGAIIRFAAKSNLKTVCLDSQNTAIPFYQKLGFVVEGDEFMDAGIPHHRMTLEVERHYPESSMQDVDPIPMGDRLMQKLDGDDSFVAAGVTLFQRANRQVRLYSECFESHWLRHPNFVAAASKWLTSHKETRLLILTRASANLKKYPQPLLTLAQRMSSHTEVKAIPQLVSFDQHDFMLADNTRIMLQQASRRPEGLFCLHIPNKGKVLNQSFESAWNQSETTIELQRLYV